MYCHRTSTGANEGELATNPQSKETQPQGANTERNLSSELQVGEDLQKPQSLTHALKVHQGTSGKREHVYIVAVLFFFFNLFFLIHYFSLLDIFYIYISFPIFWFPAPQRSHMPFSLPVFPHPPFPTCGVWEPPTRLR